MKSLDKEGTEAIWMQFVVSRVWVVRTPTGNIYYLKGVSNATSQNYLLGLKGFCPHTTEEKAFASLMMFSDYDLGGIAACQYENLQGHLRSGSLRREMAAGVQRLHDSSQAWCMDYHNEEAKDLVKWTGKLVFWKLLENINHKQCIIFQETQFKLKWFQNEIVLISIETFSFYNDQM